MLCGLLLALPAPVLGQVVPLSRGAPPRVRGLIVYHYSGQTFLRWESAGTHVRRYIVYRSRRPLRTALALRQAEQRYDIAPGSAVNRRLSDVLRLPVFYRLPGPRGVLDAGRECFVATTTESGRWYYAVTAVGPDGEFRQIRPGKNAVQSGVREQVAVPAAIFQGRHTYDGRGIDVFAHWTTNRDIPGYPAMGTLPSQAYNFAVQKNGKADIHPLTVRLHGRGDHFLNHANRNDNPQEYILALDDAIGATDTPSFWFGYDRGLDFSRRGRLPESAPGSGVVDYTLRRLRWSIEWAVRKLPIDSTRIILMGASMGGSGAAFSALHLGDRIAAVRALIPRLDYTAADTLETPHGRSALRLFRSLWGGVEQQPRTIDGDRVYDRLDYAARLASEDLRDTPPLRVISGRADSVVGWRQMLDVYRAADSTASGGMFFWDTRGHDSGSRHPWSPQQLPVELARYRSDRSWPAFSRVSANADPLREDIGQMNAAVTWYEPVIDEPARWSVGITRTTLLMRDSVYTVTGPLSADITPRRLQRFRIVAGGDYEWTMSAGGSTLATGTQRAERDGELTLRALVIPPRRARLEIRPVVGPLPNR
ncbi:MAG: hypothetical protein RBU27_08205 [Bacteroidota bacterium]|nr:hypothetical protein [Bacteroidota bacterium]